MIYVLFVPSAPPWFTKSSTSITLEVLGSHLPPSQGVEGCIDPRVPYMRIISLVCLITIMIIYKIIYIYTYIVLIIFIDSILGNPSKMKWIDFDETFNSTNLQDPSCNSLGPFM